MTLLDRMTAAHASLLIVDVQEKLAPLVTESESLVAAAVRLVRGAKLLDIPIWATEQYPRGLGATVPELASLIPTRCSKTTFHCTAVPELVEQLHGLHVRHVTVAGIETHVCVLQTALELMKLGFRVQVPADATSSRGRIDWEFALRRLELAGAVVTTTETILFEWLESSDHPRFKEFSAMIKNARSAS